MCILCVIGVELVEIRFQKREAKKKFIPAIHCIAHSDCLACISTWQKLLLHFWQTTMVLAVTTKMIVLF